MKYQTQNGVALVITLLMLSVITFLTVAFLISSRRDRASVDMARTATDARLASDHGLARAQSEVASRMIARTNRLASDLLISRTYSNPRGFDSRAGGPDLENVNYDYGTDLNPLSEDDLVKNIGNLFYDPRPPVFVRTNSDPRAPLDFRFYLDINRNGRFEPSGFLPVLDDRDEMIPDGNGGFLTNYFVGDPEWIGIKARPELPHSPTNRFIARYAFLALPVGNTLDLNFIHNYAKGALGLDEAMRDDGFQRHQGYGSWEINLAAFLQTWNPNPVTGYGNSLYQYNLGQDINMGPAFRDALGFLRYRYGGNFNNLASVENLFGAAGADFFRNDRIDGYATQPLLEPPYSYLPADPDPDEALTTRPWPGGFHANYFQDMQELFDTNKVDPGFLTGLRETVARTNSFDRYAFSRLLSQVGTHSAPNVRGKVHLNFRNDPNLNSIPTTFEEWTPEGFFTNAAARMVQANLADNQLFGRDVGNNFALTNIQIYPTNQYNADLHRLLQMSANIYDATTNRAHGTLRNFPSVFRPLFGYDRQTGRVWISGYEEVTNANEVLQGPWVDVANEGQRELLQGNPRAMIHGIPLVVGAKTGLPNFNEYSLLSAVTITRKLELVRPNRSTLPTQTNQMYLLSISNLFGVELWNSYTQAFPRAVDLYLTNRVTALLTNQYGILASNQVVISRQAGVPANFWRGAPLNLQPNLSGPPGNFMVTNGVMQFVVPSAYRHNHRALAPTNFFERGTGFPVPEWTLVISNNLTYALVDQQTRRILDFVTLTGFGTTLDLNRALQRPGLLVQNAPAAVRQLWNTNRVGGVTAINVPTVGISNQLAIASGAVTLPERLWSAYSTSVANKERAITNFRLFMTSTDSERLVMNSPFQPTISFVYGQNWQANDPLVHYTLADLTDPNRTNIFDIVFPPRTVEGAMSERSNIGRVNSRYLPWNFNDSDDTRLNPLFKDPQIGRSDHWQFPTNRFPNVGWLGRVHRGTPWQTIYLKSDNQVVGADGIRQTAPMHQKWTNDWVSTTVHTYPTADWRLLDLFTVAPHDNAARGLLSVNQTNVAAWAAVLGGSLVTTNPAESAFPLHPDVVSGAPNIQTMVDGINLARNARPNQVFQSIGQILAAPELTRESPFIPQNAAMNPGWTDAEYERIPQQIMSLLDVGEPRYVVYAFGQALKPAERAINPPDGRRDLHNLVTNYQVAGEFVSRAVVRFEGPAEAPRAVIESYRILPPPE